jgi:hypothetical protein
MIGNDKKASAKISKAEQQVTYHNTRARTLNLPATLTVEQWVETLVRFRYTCAYCLHEPYQVLDHFVPLVLLQSGTTVENCIPSCRACNGKKGSRHPDTLHDIFQSNPIANIRMWLEQKRQEYAKTEAREMNNCKNCQKALLSSKKSGGHRTREYCNLACKQAYYRKQKQQQPKFDQDTIEGQLHEAKQRITQLEAEIAQLRYSLDIEKRYYQDIQSRGFKSWLKKQPKTPLGQKILDDIFLPPRGSRALYQAHLRRLKYSEDEMREFMHLWKAMLLQQT